MLNKRVPCVCKERRCPSLTLFVHAVDTGVKSPCGQGLKNRLQKMSPLQMGKAKSPKGVCVGTWGGVGGSRTLKMLLQDD